MLPPNLVILVVEEQTDVEPLTVMMIISYMFDIKSAGFFKCAGSFTFSLVRNILFGTEKRKSRGNPEGWLVRVWDGKNLGSIPNEYPKIQMMRKCRTIFLVGPFSLAFWALQATFGGPGGPGGPGLPGGPGGQGGQGGHGGQPL